MRVEAGRWDGPTPNFKSRCPGNYSTEMDHPNDPADGPNSVPYVDDPHATDADGVGESGQYAGNSSSDSTCDECGGRNSTSGRLCESCSLAASLEERGEGKPGESTPPERTHSWVFDRVAFSLVPASNDLVALALGKAAIKMRDDLPSIPVDDSPYDTFDLYDDFNGEPAEVLVDSWPDLQTIQPSDSDTGEQILEAALANSDPEMGTHHLYDAEGTPLSTKAEVDAVRQATTDREDLWLVTAFLYQGEVDVDDDQTGVPRKTPVDYLECDTDGWCEHRYEGVKNDIPRWKCLDCGTVRPGPHPPTLETR
jgi:hypothetical protein